MKYIALVKCDHLDNALGVVVDDKQNPMITKDLDALARHVRNLSEDFPTENYHIFALTKDSKIATITAGRTKYGV